MSQHICTVVKKNARATTSLISFLGTDNLDICRFATPWLLPRCMQCRRGLAMRILSVRPSVCPSVTRVDCDKTVERSVQIYIPYERTFSLVFCFLRGRMVGGGRPLLGEILGQPTPLERNRRISTNNRS